MVEQKKLDEVKSTIEKTKLLENNTDLSTKDWLSAKEYRVDRIEELLETLRTGSTDHIVVDSEIIQLLNPKVEHFK